MTTSDKEAFDRKLASVRADQDRLRSEIVRLRKENREVKKRLSRQDALLRSFPVGFLVLEKQRIVEASEFLVDQLGYAKGEVVGHNLTDFVPSRLKNDTRELQRRRISGKWVPDECEIELVAKSREVLSWDVRAGKIFRGGRSVFLLTFSPNTGRKKREKDLMESRKRESAVRMAQEINRRLHPPLAGLGACVKNMSKRKGLDRQGCKQMEDINGQILKLTRSLESFCRDAPDPSKRTLVDLKKLVRDVVASVGPALEGVHENRSGITLKTYLRAVSPVEGDAEELQEMLAHVMFNAGEAMPHGGDLYLSIEENAGQACIYVQDSGLGIEAEALDRVFDPFFTTKEQGRQGLGLSLAQAIARRHKGVLELSSKKNEGTVVTIRLPLASSSSPRRRRRRRANEWSILLIEDDLMIRDLVSKMIEHKGYRLSAASTGAEALQQLERKPFDLVILGSTDSGAGPFNLIRKIKKKRANVSVAWIADREGKEIKGKEEDPAVDLIIRKPIDMTKTLSDLSELLTG